MSAPGWIMTITVVISCRAILHRAVTRFFAKCHVPAFLLVQFPYVVSRDAVQESARRSLFFIEFAGLPNQRKECLLHDVRCSLRAPCHVQSVAIDPALVPAVKL